MRAVLIDAATQSLYLGEAPDPVLSAGDLLIRIQATALNRADLLQRRGLYPPPPGASPILGLECAGIIEQVGSSVTGWKPGERVMALLPGGGYAEFAAVPAAMAMRVPEQLSLEEAAAIPEAFLTAYLGIVVLGRLRRGKWALIHAGASGVGTAGIQIVREIGGRSIVTAGTEQKLKACLSLGAEVAINYKTDSFQKRVEELTAQGVDLILDPVGAAYWEANLHALAVGGRLVL
ncbi:MAG: NAD(P)H-quinone oxidoreductase, partial [Candidatus Bathyarchaeia archaeon]